MIVFASKKDLEAAWARVSDGSPPPDLNDPYDSNTVPFFQFMTAYQEGWRDARSLPVIAEIKFQ